MIVRNRSWPAVSLKMRRRREISGAVTVGTRALTQDGCPGFSRATSDLSSCCGQCPLRYYSVREKVWLRGPANVSQLGTQQSHRLPYLCFLGVLPRVSGLGEPQLDVIICIIPGLCVWKGLVVWPGNTALADGLSCWVTSAGETQEAPSRHLSGGQGASPSSLA